MFIYFHEFLRGYNQVLTGISHGFPWLTRVQATTFCGMTSRQDAWEASDHSRLAADVFKTPRLEILGVMGMNVKLEHPYMKKNDNISKYAPKPGAKFIGSIRM